MSHIVDRSATALAELKEDLVEAAARLGSAPEVDASFEERWSGLADRLREVREGLRVEDYDRDQAALLFSTLFDIRDLLDGPRDLDTIDRLVLAVERVRHVIRDALDERVDGDGDGDTAAVVARLDERLPGVTRDDLAGIVGVDRRTLSRWRASAAPPGERLRLVARLVAILGHSWTPAGIVAWFHRPRRDLGGRTPLAVLSRRNPDEEALVSAARAGRSMYAT
jgi:transcriptional regulator with XRE-family HTH domain